MDYIAYVAAAGASLVVAPIMWWAFGRYQSRLVRCLFVGGAILLGFVVYFVFGIVLIPILTTTTTEASAAGSALGSGAKILTSMLLAVTAATLSIGGWRKRGQS